MLPASTVLFELSAYILGSVAVAGSNVIVEAEKVAADKPLPDSRNSSAHNHHQTDLLPVWLLDATKGQMAIDSKHN